MTLKKHIKKITEVFYRKSVKLTWLISYFAIVVMLLILILWAENVFFDVIVEDTITLRDEKTSDFSKRMDELTEECKLFALNLSMNERFMDVYTEGPKTAWDNNELRVVAKEVQKGMDSVEEFFVYIKKDNVVINSSGHVSTPKHFYDIYYRNSGLDYDEWMEKFLNYKYAGYYVFEDSDSQSVRRLSRFCYIFPLEQLYDKEATIFTEINSSDYEAEISKLDQFNDMSVLIYDSAGEIYFSKGEYIPDTKQLAKGEENKSFYETRIDGERVMLCVKSSDFATWKYAFVIPYSSFWSRLIQVKYIGAAIFIVIALMGILGIYLVARYNYKAVAGIIKKIESDFSTSSAKEENEYVRISKMIDVASQYKRKIATQQNHERGNLIMKLLLGISISDKEKESIKTYFENNTFITAVFCAPECETQLFADEKISADKKGEACRLIVNNILTELLESYGSIDAVDLNNMTFLFSPKEKYMNNAGKIMSEKAEEMIETVFKHFELDIICGISSHVKEPEDISIAYREALSALNRFNENSGRGINIYDKKSVLEKSYYYPVDQMQYLIMLISKGKKEEALQQIGLIFEVNSAVFELENLAKALVTDVAATIMKAALSIGYKIDTEKLMECAKTTNKKTINSMLKAYISDICEFVLEDSAGQDITLVEKANALIVENYKKTEFNVNMIAEILGVSANSLSVIYKRKTGGNLLEYIQTMRVKEAKRLLEECDDAVENVAKIAGFGSNTTFRRVFKKVTGVSPGTYREIKRKEQKRKEDNNGYKD